MTDGENMFYLFEIAYKFELKNEAGEFYELTQVIAKELDEAKKTIVTTYDKRNISEIKLLKITPITSSYITYSMTISDRIYHQFGPTNIYAVWCGSDLLGSMVECFDSTEEAEKYKEWYAQEHDLDCLRVRPLSVYPKMTDAPMNRKLPDWM